MIAGHGPQREEGGDEQGQGQGLVQSDHHEAGESGGGRPSHNDAERGQDDQGNAQVANELV